MFKKFSVLLQFSINHTCKKGFMDFLITNMDDLTSITICNILYLFVNVISVLISMASLFMYFITKRETGWSNQFIYVGRKMSNHACLC